MNSSLGKRGLVAVLFILAVFVISPTVLAYQITGNAMKTNQTTINAGVTPDSWLYPLDVAMDKINLALTFNPTEKAKKGLNIARERLMEVREMIKENKLNDSKIAQKGYINVLDVVQSSVKKIEKTNSTQEIKDQIEIETDLEKHKAEIAGIKGELNVRMKVKGNITQKQQALVDSIFGDLENKTGEVETEIESEKNKTETKMEKESGKNRQEVENEVGNLEEASGLKEIRRERAWNKIRNAEDEINRTAEISNRLNINQGNRSFSSEILTQAKSAYFAKDYKKSIKLAEQAKNSGRNHRGEFEKELEAEKEISVAVYGNQSSVKVNIAGAEARFVLDTSNRTEIISKIAGKTGLSASEIKSILQIKKREQESEIEVETENGRTHVKTKVNERESEFILNTTNKGEIISRIKERTGLNKEQIEKNANFGVKLMRGGESEKGKTEMNKLSGTSGRKSGERD